MGKVLGKVDGQINGGQSVVSKNGFYIIVKTYKECYYVVATTSSESEDSVIASTGLPAIGSAGHGGYLMTKMGKELMTVIHPTSGVTTLLWEVTCAYTSDIDGDQAGGAGGDPTDFTPKRRTHSLKEKVVVVDDAQSGEPIVTLADEPMLVEDDFVYHLLEITRYETYPWDMDISNTYINRVNLNSFYGAPTGCVLMDDIVTEEVTINSQLYISATYVLKFKIQDDINNPGNFLSNTYRRKVLHEGYMYRPPYRNANGTIIPSAYSAPENFIDAKGQPSRVNLDSLVGTLLPEGDPPNFLYWWTKTKIDFTPLALVF